MGYPAATREYLPSYGDGLIAKKENPLKVELRRQRIDIINAAMDESHLVRIQYSEKAQRIANYWKKMTGESRGIGRIDAVSEKERFEQRFRLWADSIPERKSLYGGLFPAFKSAYEGYLPVDL